VKGECRSKIKTKFFHFDYSEPHPALFKDNANREQYKVNEYLLLLPRCRLSYLKVVKGECRSKIKMKFFNFDYAEPHPT